MHSCKRHNTPASGRSNPFQAAIAMRTRDTGIVDKAAAALIGAPLDEKLVTITAVEKRLIGWRHTRQRLHASILAPEHGRACRLPAPVCNHPISRDQPTPRLYLSVASFALQLPHRLHDSDHPTTRSCLPR
jgi:hypothetical protein